MPRNRLQDAQAAVNRVLGRGEADIADNPVAMDPQMPEGGWAVAQAAAPNDRNWYAVPQAMPLDAYGQVQVGGYDGGIHATKPSKYIDTMARERYLTLAYKILAGTADKTIEDVIAAAGQIDAYVNGTNERD